MLCGQSFKFARQKNELDKFVSIWWHYSSKAFLAEHLNFQNKFATVTHISITVPEPKSAGRASVGVAASLLQYMSNCADHINEAAEKSVEITRRTGICNMRFTEKGFLFIHSAVIGFRCFSILCFGRWQQCSALAVSFETCMAMPLNVMISLSSSLYYFKKKRRKK